MQVIYPPAGLLPYPNANYGEETEKLGNTIAAYIKTRKQQEDEKEAKKLELYLKSGEISGEFNKPTPEIQKAFSKIYGTQPTGILAEGGKTIEGKKTTAEIANLEATTKRSNAMADWYSRRQSADKNADVKALDYAVKYANSKLGKPFEVLSDEERGMWQTYHDEGMQEFFRISGGGSKDEGLPTGPKKDTYTEEQTNFINAWKTLPKEELNKVTNKEYRKRLSSKLRRLGLTMSDLQ